MDPKYSHLSLNANPREFCYFKAKDAQELREAERTLQSGGYNEYFSFTTPDEYSLIAPSNANVEIATRNSGWRVLRIEGDMPFGTVEGLIATISGALKAAGIGICVVSTFDSDYFFVKSTRFAEAVDRLKAEGWEVR